MATVENPKLVYGDRLNLEWRGYDGPLFGDESGVKVWVGDIGQGMLADCYFLATLAELAQHTPNHIKTLIQENNNHTYTITGIGGLDSFQIDNQLPYEQSYNVPVYSYYSVNNQDLSMGGWVALLEKAYAYANSQENLQGPINPDGSNAYTTIEYGYPGGCLTDLTGVKNHVQMLTQETPDRKIFNLLTANRPTILCMFDHSYSVMGYDSSVDEYMVFNPDDPDGPYGKLEYLTLGEIKKHGQQIAWIETKETDLNLKNSHDYLLGTKSNDHLRGKSGNDLLDGWNGDDLLVGGLDDDLMIGSYGNDTLNGGEDNDQLYGRQDQDNLRGNNGNDCLSGGLEDDLLSGGRGRDRFIFNSVKEGIDTISDFNPSSDFIVINRSGFSDQLDQGFLKDTQLLKIAKLDDFEGNFGLGFVYATQSGRFAYLDSEQVLHQIAILQNTPELEASNIQQFCW